jgi:hypothetical protein
MSGDLSDALRQMELAAKCAGTKRPLYHASINPRADEHLTEAQWAQSIERLESELGLTGQPRAVVAHVKDGREHMHIVWSRIDLEHRRAIRMDHNFRKHESVARDLEREFGHERVQGAHVERQGRERPERTPSHAEMQQAARTGMSPAQAKAQITALWRSTGTGKEFAAALDQAGWILARGDRRDFVLIDGKGGVHSLARRVDGATASDIRARMADVDPATLPSVREARTTMRDREPRQATTLLKFPRTTMRRHERERSQRLAA